LGRGFAYIDFVSADEAEVAMKHMDGGQIDGQVNWKQIIYPVITFIYWALSKLFYLIRK